jgi:MoaA/NifB/PqqE/SkfB family radical SAM enzyme
MGARFAVDIELTNRCNAKCHFCPRDQTPHQGTMGPDVFDQALTRVVEFGSAFPERIISINLCGLGEPLLNRHAPTYVRAVRDAGFKCGMSSNASLLDEKKATALLEAGLQKISINVADVDEDYERVYKLGFQKTHDNIVRFAEMAVGRCEVEIIQVNYRGDKQHERRMQEYWGARGITQFFGLEVMNRGGALFVDHMQFESFPELAEAKRLLEEQSFTPKCDAPFVFLFIGYDGQYYLCCSDWKKEVPLGSVFDTSFIAIRHMKLAHVCGRDPVCKTCNLDPTNRLVEELRSVSEGEPDNGRIDKLLAELRIQAEQVQETMAEMDGVADLIPPSPPPRRRIPLTVR